MCLNSVGSILIEICKFEFFATQDLSYLSILRGPTLTQQSLKTNSHIQLVDKRLIDPLDDHIPFKIPASKKTSEELFITVQSSLMRNFLVSCNPLRDTHLITNDLMEDTATNYERSPYSNDDLLIKCFDSLTQSAPL